MSGAIEKLEQEATAAERRAAFLRKIMALAEEVGDDGLNELAELLRPAKKNGNGASKKPKVESEPRGREAVRRIAEEKPGLWTMDEFKKAMREKKWFTSSRGVENAVSRLVSDRVLRRVGKGRYQFPANEPDEAVMFR